MKRVRWLALRQIDDFIYLSGFPIILFILLLASKILEYILPDSFHPNPTLHCCWCRRCRMLRGRHGSSLRQCKSCHYIRKCSSWPWLVSQPFGIWVLHGMITQRLLLFMAGITVDQISQVGQRTKDQIFATRAQLWILNNWSCCCERSFLIWVTLL